MKIDISKIDQDCFVVRPTKIADEICYLVFPKNIMVKWNKENLIFRSSIWNSEGELISASYKKFFNYGEAPQTVDHPTDMSKVELLTKIDGSLLCVSRFHGELIVRTRGTSDATVLDNGFEIETLKKKYPLAFQFEEDTPGFSRIFEWTTPYNKIILEYGSEPQLWYTGKVFHDRYKYASQTELDLESKIIQVQRPQWYTFKTIEEMLATVEAFKGIEGVCCYFNHGQDIRKIKGADYLARHRFKSMASFENSLDLFFQYGKPNYLEFEKKLIEQFDYECYEMVRGFISEICDGWKEVLKIIEGMQIFVDRELSKLPDRKSQALKVTEAYGQTNRAGYVFKLLDHKPIDEAGLKKLVYQVTKR